MCIHLINDTHFYFEQINICLFNNDTAQEEASPHAKKMFLRNSFPNQIIEGEPSNQFIQQPASKEQLTNSFINLKNRITGIELLMTASVFNGKTKHPGLNYFSAEWLQFAGMYCKHHVKQKKRIDHYLKMNYIN